MQSVSECHRARWRSMVTCRRNSICVILKLHTRQLKAITGSLGGFNGVQRCIDPFLYAHDSVCLSGSTCQTLLWWSSEVMANKSTFCLQVLDYFQMLFKSCFCCITDSKALQIQILRHENWYLFPKPLVRREMFFKMLQTNYHKLVLQSKFL